jgi:hypothetical protein
MTPLLTLPLHRFLPARYRPGNLGTWSGHLPFANDLVNSLRPGLLVELGSHYGESYFGFCQAVTTSQTPCRCFAVDTWRGDEHAGFYANDVFEEVNEYNRQNYGSFSTLIRATFDEASAQFPPNSIDLLHIDGLHTYAAVRQDFDTWFPKVKPGGIVLLHDIAVRHTDFEVWRLWEELSSQYASFAFHHCWGLGVLQKPGGPAFQPGSQPDFLQLLFSADRPTTELIRQEYSEAAELLEYRQRSPKTPQAVADAGRPYLQVFPGSQEAGFKENESLLLNVEPDIWQRHAIQLPRGASNGHVRIDPVNRPAFIQVSLLTVRDANGTQLLEWGRKQLAHLQCGHQLIAVTGGECASFFSSGSDPQWLLELPPEAKDKFPLLLELSMRVSFNLEPVRDLLLAPPPVQLTGETEDWESRLAALQTQVQALQVDRPNDAVERNRILAEQEELQKHANILRTAAVREESVRTRLEWDLSFAKTQIGDRDASAAKLRAELKAVAAELDRLRAELATKQASIRNLQALAAAYQERAEALTDSLSWRATSPFRAIVGTLLNE